jgi:hypothetical protein
VASIQTTGIETEEYQMALAENIRIGGKDGIDAVLNKYNLDALVVPSEGMVTTPPALVGIPDVELNANGRISHRHCTAGCLEEKWTTIWIVVYWDGIHQLSCSDE